MVNKRTYEVPALVRALKILDYLSKQEEALFTQIYTNLDIPKSSAYQILSTLETYDYIKQDISTGKYTLGFKLFELGFSMGQRIDIRKEALPSLQELTRKTNLTAQLGVLDGLDAVYLEKVDSPDGVIVKTWVGKRAFLHCTGIGKALLAWQSEEKRNNLISNINLCRNTTKTITDKEELKKHLEKIRQQGFALDDEENLPYIRSMAMPVFGSNGEIRASISIAGLITQFSFENIPSYFECLKQTTEQLSKKLAI